MHASRYKAAVSRAIEPLARAFAGFGMSPSQLTLAGLGLVIASCLWLLVTGQRLVFCALVTAASLFDALDGAVARATGRVTKFGAYLDAMCDRYAEAAVLVTVAAVTGYWLLSLAVLSGFLLVSYAKARAAMEVAVSNLEWPDLMERTERDALYLIGFSLSVLLPLKPLGRDLFWWTLLLLAALTHATVVQRIRRARRIIQERG